MSKIFCLIFFFFTFSAAGQMRNSIKTKEFSHPLSFDPIGNGVELLPLYIDYDLETSQGESLSIGNISVSDETLSFQLKPLTRLDSRLSPLLAKDANNFPSEWVFLFKWPEHLMREGTLEMISRTGRVLWSAEITSKKLESWAAQLEAWKALLLKAKHSREDLQKVPLFKYQFGIRQAHEGQTPFWTVREPFRFCFFRQEEKGLTRLCSALHEVLRNQKQVQLSPVPLSKAPPRVILMNESAPLKDHFVVPMGQPVQFYAELSSGLSYEFVAIPRKVNIVDMIRDRRNQEALVTLESELPPLMNSSLMNKEKNPEWIEWLGWQQTIGDFRKFWRVRIPIKNSSLLVPGLGGGAFKQDLAITKLPTEEVRPYVHRRTIKGTYVDGPSIQGLKAPSVKLSSNENSVEMPEEGTQEFTWSFGAKEKGEFNRSYLLVSDGENTFRSYYEAFKGYSTEISTRLTSVLGASGADVSTLQLTFMGEIAVNHWFESLLGWNNYWLSKQRWGTSLKAFQAITPLDISGRKSTLTSYTGELKYRLNPGLWGRDETWGLLGGYQKVSFDTFNGEMLGVGFFWARSMPRVFEPLMNWLKFFDFPKWVDLEFIYYPVSMNANVLGRGGAGNWALNFHGQVMFTDYFFGEAGFGLKQYDVSNEGQKDRYGRVPNLSFTASYGTLGLGYKF